MVNHFRFCIMPSVKEFSTYILESPVVKVGKFTNSNGEDLEITKEIASEIYTNLNGAAPLKDIHMDGTPIGTIQKFVLKDDGIYQKSVINDVQRFESRYNNGNCFISPEIDVDKNGSIKLIGAALTNNPGMISEKPMITRHYFEAPVTDAPKSEASQWQEPLGELKSTINTLNDAISNLGKNMNQNTTTNTPTTPSAQPAEPTTPAPSADKMTLSVDDLAKLVNDAVEKRIASMQSPKTPEASETVPEQSNTVPDDGLAKEYANLKGELDNLKKTQEKAYLKQFNTLVADMKALGIEHPEKMAPEGLTTEQKITILESIKENFAKNSPMSAPLQEPLAGSATGTKKPNSITVDDVLSQFDVTFGSTDGSGSIRDDPTMRHNLSKLSDPDLMRKYNMNVLFDTNGNYIGPM